MLIKKTFKDRKIAGFTLIEIMVACSIFIIVMFIAIGSILSLVNANRKARALSSVINNLNIGLESMIRDIRTGTEYDVQQLSSGNQGIVFKDAEGNSVTYTLATNGTSYKIRKDVVIKAGNPIRPSGDITAPEVKIESMTLLERGTSPSDDLQPLLLLRIKGSAGATKYNSPFVVQTLISQRVLDN